MVKRMPLRGGIRVFARQKGYADPVAGPFPVSIDRQRSRLVGLRAHRQPAKERPCSRKPSMRRIPT